MHPTACLVWRKWMAHPQVIKKKASSHCVTTMTGDIYLQYLCIILILSVVYHIFAPHSVHTATIIVFIFKSGRTNTTTHPISLSARHCSLGQLPNSLFLRLFQLSYLICIHSPLIRCNQNGGSTCLRSITINWDKDC